MSYKEEAKIPFLALRNPRFRVEIRTDYMGPHILTGFTVQGQGETLSNGES